jgi:hypothetical protein
MNKISSKVALKQKMRREFVIYFTVGVVIAVTGIVFLTLRTLELLGVQGVCK